MKSILLALGSTAALTASMPQTENLVFVTGSLGGSWYPTGGAIKSTVEGLNDEFSIRVGPCGGLANIKEISIVQAFLEMSNTISAAFATTGREPSTEPMERICNVAHLYLPVVQAAVVDTDMASSNDFKGKRLAVTPRGSTAAQLARLVLSTVDPDYDDLYHVNFASMSDQVNMMKDGQLDGFFQAT